MAITRQPTAREVGEAFAPIARREPLIRELWVTEQTVKFHLSNTYRKLGVANRTEASRYAHMNDLIAA